MPIARRAVPIAVLGVLLALSGPVPASAASTKPVAIKLFRFRPAIVKVPMGGSVQWTNQESTAHTATSDGKGFCCPDGPALWDSGNLNLGQQYTFVFAAAGGYAYHCAYHASMRGTVQVSPNAGPKNGGTSTVFTITWAVGSVPTGFNADVQLKVPGGGWADWRVNQTGTHVSASYTPGAGTGTYRFRARLEKQDGGASGWSPRAKITVS
jgi:plastocyanin